MGFVFQQQLIVQPLTSLGNPSHRWLARMVYIFRHACVCPRQHNPFLWSLNRRWDTWINLGETIHRCYLALQFHATLCVPRRRFAQSARLVYLKLYFYIHKRSCFAQTVSPKWRLPSNRTIKNSILQYRVVVLACLYLRRDDRSTTTSSPRTRKTSTHGERVNSL